MWEDAFSRGGKKWRRNTKKIFVENYEIKQQILDIIVIIVNFLVAMSLGKICMNEYNGTWLLFYVSTFMLIIAGMGIWRYLKKRNNKKNRTYK